MDPLLFEKTDLNAHINTGAMWSGRFYFLFAYWKMMVGSSVSFTLLEELSLAGSRSFYFIAYTCWMGRTETGY